MGEGGAPTTMVGGGGHPWWGGGGGRHFQHGATLKLYLLNAAQLKVQLSHHLGLQTGSGLARPGKPPERNSARTSTFNA
jgi:hypothetical protein